MSSATLVRETFELTGDDARETLKHTGRRRLAKDALVRMRYADGFSHSRSMAFVLSLVLVQGTIAMVGLASALGSRGVSRGIVTAVQGLAPGPAGRVLTDAVRQAQESGASGRYVALTLGVLGTLVSGSTAMGQLERGLNRIYGIEQDRPAVAKYSRALLLAITVGVLLTVAFVVVGFGPAIGRSIDNGMVADLWGPVRWPVSVVLVSAGMALLFRWCPHRHQPGWSWLVVGSSVAVVLWFLVTLAMGITFRLSHSFGDTYGPLAGIVALQLWCVLSSMAIFYGGAVAAQLEAVRAGTPSPRDPGKADPDPPAPGPSASRSSPVTPTAPREAVGR